MTELQNALRNVIPPKVNPRVALQGARYQGATQQAQNVSTENHAKSMLGILNDAGQIYGKAVDNSWKEAEQTYQHAIASGRDPMEVAAEKAKEESDGLIGNVVSSIKSGIGLDPLPYSKAVTGANQVRDELIQVDKDFQIQIDRGDFAGKDWEFIKKARDEQRRATIKGVAESVGLRENDPFLLDGAAKHNEEGMQVLASKHAMVTEQALVIANKKRLNSDTSLLIEQNVKDPKVFIAMLDKARQDGTLRNDIERSEALNHVLTAVMEKGDSVLLENLMMTKVEVNGEMLTLGDTLEPTVRDQLLLKSDENLIQKNKELFIQFNNGLAAVSRLSASGNAAGALNELSKWEGWLSKYQDSGQVTSQVRQIQALRSQVLDQQMQHNAALAKNNAKETAQIALDNDADERIRQRLAGEIVALDHNDIAGMDKGTMDKAFARQLELINNDNTLSIEQRQQAIYRLGSIAPKGSEFHAAIQSHVQRGVHDVTNAIATIKTTGKTQELPQGAQAVLQMYKSNPSGFQQVASPEQYAVVSALSTQIDNFGWENTARAHGNFGVSKETQKEMEQVKGEMQRKYNLSDSQAEQLMVGAKVNLPNTQSSTWWGGNSGTNVQAAFDEAYKQAAKETTALNSGSDILPNSALLPFGDPKGIPTVKQALETKVEALKANSEVSFVSVQETVDGRIEVTAFPSGVPVYYNANDLYTESVRASTQPEVDKAKQLEAALSTRKSANQVRDERLEKVRKEGFQYGTQPNDPRNRQK